MNFSIDQANKIKLIIWDLDDTFWKGTLSDHETSIVPIEKNIDLVKKTTYRGIVNAVCSKNDSEDANKMLKDLGINDYFVFNSINWEPKGMRLKNLISSMALRPANVLFLDDNPSNLAEAEFVMPEIMVSDPGIINGLYDICDSLGKDDNTLSRLNQYRVLEKKRDDAEEYSSNEEFLRNSNIVIQFSDIDEAAISRIIELIQRSNQLNFTKKRIGEKELRLLMSDNIYKIGYVSVSDNYGKYGIVGFYALNTLSNTLEHFLFSCRTMGMGIEQYVYAYLGFPILEIVEPVSGTVSKEDGLPDYISEVEDINKVESSAGSISKHLSILLKGPCDLEVMASYIESHEITLEKEFNFVDDNGNQADYFNHSVNILNNNKELIDSWCDRYSFLSRGAFESKVFSGEYDVVCLSPLMDATLALYKDNRGNGIAYGLYSKPMTNPKFHNEYIQKKVMTARSSFQEEELKRFSKEFKAVEYTSDEIVTNIAQIARQIREKNSKTKIVIILLGEMEYISESQEYYSNFPEKHIIHRRINEKLRKIFDGDKDVYLLDVNKYIKKQADYFDNINHYSKLVYYQMAIEFVEYIRSVCDAEIGTSSKIKMMFENMKRSIYRKLFIK